MSGSGWSWSFFPRRLRTVEAYLGDAEFRSQYLEDEEHAEQHPAAVPGTPIWEVRL